MQLRSSKSLGKWQWQWLGWTVAGEPLGLRTQAPSVRLQLGSSAEGRFALWLPLPGQMVSGEEKLLHLAGKRDGRSLFQWSPGVFPHHWFLERWFWAEASKDRRLLLPPGTLCQPWNSACGHTHQSKLLETFQLAKQQGLWQLEMEWGGWGEAAVCEGLRGVPGCLACSVIQQ